MIDDYIYDNERKCVGKSVVVAFSIGTKGLNKREPRVRGAL